MYKHFFYNMIITWLIDIDTIYDFNTCPISLSLADGELMPSVQIASRQEEYFHRIDKFLDDPVPVQSSLEDPAPLSLSRHGCRDNQLASEEIPSTIRYSDDEADEDEDEDLESRESSISCHSYRGGAGGDSAADSPAKSFGGAVFPSRADDVMASQSPAHSPPASPATSVASSKSLKR